MFAYEDAIERTTDIPKAKKNLQAKWLKKKKKTYQPDYTSPSQVALGQCPERSWVTPGKAQIWTQLRM